VPARARGPFADRAVGLDLAGSPGRRTGFCLLGPGGRLSVAALGSDVEVLAACRAAGPEVIGIDAPLSLPLGRVRLDVRDAFHFRSADRELRRLGIPFFPLTLGPMRRLTERGMRLRHQLEAEGFRTIETYPGAAQDLLGIPRKQSGTEALRRGLWGLGLRGDLRRTDLSHDELDGVTCAFVGRAYLRGDFLAIGRPDEGLMVLPSRRACLARYRARGLDPDQGPPARPPDGSGPSPSADG
jgi:predicted nuclease with RNAse H fold